MFQVVLKAQLHYRRPAALFYEVASNGLFQVRDTHLYRAVTRVHTGVPGLLPAWEEVELRVPSLPSALLEEVLAFFRDAWRAYGGEAMVVIFYHVSGEFRVGVPPQTVGGYYDTAGVFCSHHQLSYGRVAAPAGFERLGTIHSHANLPAYASAVDCMDEQYQDGLHAVFGELDRPVPSRSASFVANQVRFKLLPDEVMEEARMPPRAAPAEWMARVSQGGDPSQEIAPAPSTGWVVAAYEEGGCLGDDHA
jgi:proteasome lid subunit RPN8/RPN11